MGVSVLRVPVVLGSKEKDAEREKDTSEAVE